MCCSCSCHRFAAVGIVVAFNRSPEKVDSIKEKGAIPAYTISEIFENLEGGFSETSGGRKVIWLMVPWQTVDEVLDQVIPNLKAGDIVIDGGNSPFEKVSSVVKNWPTSVLILWILVQVVVLVALVTVHV